MITRQALRDYLPGGRSANRLLPLPDYGCIYVKNAKAACSTVVLWLHRIHTGHHGFLPESDIHREHRLPRPKDVGWPQVVDMLNGQAFRFSFVREPIRRVESAYLDKIVRHDNDRWRSQIRETIAVTDESPPTLEQFVDALEVQEPARMDSHWRPQHLNLLHPLVEYDLIGRLETFDADLARVREATGLPYAPVTVRNMTSRPSGSLFDGRPNLRRRVEQIYARDFELYGY